MKLPNDAVASALLVVFSVFAASAATVYVATPENGGSDATGDGSAGTPYETVPFALRQAGAAGIVNVGEGTFEFSVTDTGDTTPDIDASALILTNGESIVGAGAGKTVFTMTSTKGRMFWINSEGSTVEGVTVVNCGGRSSRWKNGLAAVVKAGTIRDSNFLSNNWCIVQSSYGVISLEGSKAVLSHCVIKDNGWLTGTCKQGGAVYVSEGAKVDNCLIAHNRMGMGAGMRVQKGTVSNCTVADNFATKVDGCAATDGGIYLGAVSGVKIRNTIFLNNHALEPTGDTGGEEYEYHGQNKTNFAKCFENCAFGNDNGVAAIGAGAKSVNTGCVVDFAGGDYTEAKGALTIDGGVPYDGIAEFDLAGNDRVMGNAPDIGCYEYDSSRFECGIVASAAGVFPGEPVTFSATIFGTNGTESLTFAWTLTDAAGNVLATSDEEMFTYVAETVGAISARLSVTADGVKTETDSKAGITMVRPNDMFVIVGENPNARAPYEDWAHAATNLLDLIDYAVAGQTLHLGEGTFYGPANTEKAAFTVEKGIALSGAGIGRTVLALDPEAARGRVLFLQNKLAVVSDVTITGGKGIGWWYNDGGSGVKINAGTLVHSRVTGCAPAVMQASYGAVYLTSADAKLSHCIIDGNNVTSPSERNGGGVYVKDGAVDNCLIVSNAVKGTGAGLGVAGSARVSNCTVADNASTGAGGGLYVNGSGYYLYNCLFCRNTATAATGTKGGDEVEYDASMDARLVNCAFANATVTAPIGVSGKIFAAEAIGADYMPVRGCSAIDGGTTYADIAAFDLAGNDRVIGIAPDIGCYEYDTSAFDCGIDIANPEIFIGASTVLGATVYGTEEGEELAYAWSITDADGREVLSGDKPTITFPGEAAGYYNASLTVTRGGGESKSDSRANAVLVRPDTMFVVAGENPDARAPYADWEHAATNLAEVLDFAVAGQTVRIGEGTYFGALNLVDAAFCVRRNVTVIGAGVDKTVLTLDPAATHGRVLMIGSSEAVVSNVTVTGGKGLKWWYDDGGSGVKINAGTLVHSRVTGCAPAVMQARCGAVYVNGSSSAIVNCIVDGNNRTSACERNGGGIYVDSGKAYGCLVVSNAIQGAGAGLAVVGAARIENCTVFGNEASGTAGGITLVNNERNCRVRNCIFAGNLATKSTGSDGGEEYEAPADSAAFARCFSNCGFAAAAAVGEGSLAVADLDAVGFRNIEGGDFALDNHSPFYKKGVYQTWMDGAKDLAGNDRVVKFRKGTWLVDIGAYESPWVGPGFMLLLK